MPVLNYYVTDEEFIQIWNQVGSPLEVAKKTGIDVRAVYKRRRNIEARYKIKLLSFANPQHNPDFYKKVEQSIGHARRGMDLQKGRIIVFSDAHFWPDEYTTAYKGLLEMIKEFKPKAVIANGDVFDGSQASRHPRIGWQKTPSVKEELEACQKFMNDIEKVGGNACEYIWTMGNHDARFETFLAASVPQYEGVPGYSLKDHFPMWKPCWSYWVNEDTVIKHRFKGGFGAGRANTLNAGVNMITGHTHQLKVEPLTDYNGTRYGVQTGTLADPNGQQFMDYTEDNPKDWRSGFVLLSWERSRLLMPELVQVCGEDEVEFRGKIWQV